MLIHSFRNGFTVQARRPVPTSERKTAHFFLSGRCVSADPAADLESFPVRPSRRTFEADFPALLPVCSFFAIFISKWWPPSVAATE